MRARTEADRIHILLVEDEAILMMVASEVLADAGYAVRECVSSEEALAALDSGYRPAMIVTDNGLPGISGSDMARIAADRYGIRHILIATGDSSECATGFPILNKPYRDQELIDQVARALGASAAA